MAHEIAIKAAETDATKRALATFGNPFGLALYDTDKLQVTQSRRTPTSLRARLPRRHPLALRVGETVYRRGPRVGADSADA